jgi:ABC-2 type transport system ATP-binding protein
MQKGRVVAEGSPEELKASQGSRSIRCVTALSASFLTQLPGVLSAEMDGRTMLIRTHAPEAVLRAMLQADATLSGLEVRSAGLEETFLALTKNN